MEFLTRWMGLAALCLGMGLGAVRADDSGVRADSKPAFVNIDVGQFEKLRADTNHVVLDVRTKGEFDKGHIPGAILIDVNQAGFEKAVARLDRSKTYLVHCAAGIRSMKACNSMRGMEFTNLYNLKGGYRAWEKEAKPATKK
jgi:rhodanese-related sulfurtransferase